MKNRLLIIGLSVFLSGAIPSQAIEHCTYGKKRAPDVTCVVDGDTVWLDGVKLRLSGFDAPETRLKLCGGNKERELGKRAAERLKQLLNNNSYDVEYLGLEAGGTRTIATISIDGKDVGQTLIEEKLARAWPNGDEFWCYQVTQ